MNWRWIGMYDAFKKNEMADIIDNIKITNEFIELEKNQYYIPTAISFKDTIKRLRNETLKMLDEYNQKYNEFININTLKKILNESMKTKEAKDIIDLLESSDYEFTLWEMNFFESIKKSNFYRLSPRQKEKLINIYYKVYTDEN